MNLIWWSPLAGLSVTLDNVLTINFCFAWPLSFVLHVAVLLFSFFFLIDTENVIYVFMCSTKHSNCPVNSFTNSVLMKWYQQFDPLCNTPESPFRALCSRYRSYVLHSYNLLCNDTGLELFNNFDHHYHHWFLFWTC